MSEWRITISPDPTRIVNKTQKRSYLACTPQEQYRICKKGIMEAIYDMINTEHENVEWIEIELYSELNKQHCIHMHGNITFKLTAYAFDFDPRTYFRRLILRHLGREYIRGNPEMLLQACCDMQNTEWRQLQPDGFKYKTWWQYVLKDQTETHLKKYPCIKETVSSLDRLHRLLSIEDPTTQTYKEYKKKYENLLLRARGLVQ